jgi:hypothetical protein
MFKSDLYKDHLFRASVLGGILLLITGCSQVMSTNTPDGPILSSETAQTAETQHAPTSPIEGDATQMTQPQPTPTDPGLQSLIEKAKEDLVQRLNIPVTQIGLVEAKTVVWPDASLGCPEEGMAYAQVLTPGYLIRLQLGDQVFEYHASRGSTVIFCENPTPPVPGTPGDI